MKIKLITAVSVAVSLSACSTVVNGSNQLVAFDTGEVVGANCVATGGSSNAVNESFVTPAFPDWRGARCGASRRIHRW